MTLPKIIKQKPLLWIYVASAVLLLLTGGLWMYKTCVNPENVFWRTIDQSLATSGVTIRAQQNSANATMQYTVQYSMGAKNQTHSLTKMSQGNTVVVNEMIGTPDYDYTRYVSIKTDQRSASGKPLDFSKVLGQWSRGELHQNQLLPQAVLGTGLPLGGVGVPIANLGHSARKELIAQMRSGVAFKVDYKTVEKNKTTYTYNVQIEPEAYVTVMKKYAAAAGFHALDSLDPGMYKGQPAFKLQITIDIRSHHVVRLAAADQGFEQTYSGYDVPVSIDLPQTTVTSAELQTRLNNLQN